MRPWGSFALEFGMIQNCCVPSMYHILWWITHSNRCKTPHSGPKNTRDAKQIICNYLVIFLLLVLRRPVLHAYFLVLVIDLHVQHVASHENNQMATKGHGDAIYTILPKFEHLLVSDSSSLEPIVRLIGAHLVKVNRACADLGQRICLPRQ